MPNTDSASRSERLLRDALLKDDLERSSPSRPSHRRRHSHAQVSTTRLTALPVLSQPASSSDNETDDLDFLDSDEAAQYTIGTFLFRSAINATPPSLRHNRPRVSAPTTHPRQHHRSSNHSERSPSPSAGRSRFPRLFDLTPHEVQLRQRLEKVLVSDSAPEKVQGLPQRRCRRRSNEVCDEEGGWPWRSQGARSQNTPPTSVSRKSSSPSPSVASSQSPRLPYVDSPSASSHSIIPIPSPPSYFTPNPHSSRRRTEPATGPHTAPTTPRRHAFSLPLQSPSPLVTPSRKPVMAIPEETTSVDSRLLTPPPTPPLDTAIESRPQAFSHSPRSKPRSLAEPVRAVDDILTFRRPTHPPIRSHKRSATQMHTPYTPPRSNAISKTADNTPISNLSLSGPWSADRPTFNARKASAQACRMEGYISFDRVEGLGGPPLPLDGNDADESEVDGPGDTPTQPKRRWGMWTKLIGTVDGLTR